VASLRFFLGGQRRVHLASCIPSLAQRGRSQNIDPVTPVNVAPPEVKATKTFSTSTPKYLETMREGESLRILFITLRSDVRCHYRSFTAIGWRHELPDEA